MWKKNKNCLKEKKIVSILELVKFETTSIALVHVNDTNSDLQGIGEGIIDEEDASTQALSNNKIQLQIVDKKVRFTCLLDLLIWGHMHFQ